MLWMWASTSIVSLIPQSIILHLSHEDFQISCLEFVEGDSSSPGCKFCIWLPVNISLYQKLPFPFRKNMYVSYLTMMFSCSLYTFIILLLQPLPVIIQKRNNFLTNFIIFGNSSEIPIDLRYSKLLILICIHSYPIM